MLRLLFVLKGRSMKVYVLPLFMHIVAEDADEAQRWLDHYFPGGDGPASISVEGGGTLNSKPVPVFYVNCETLNVDESNYEYDTDDMEYDEKELAKWRLPQGDRA